MRRRHLVPRFVTYVPGDLEEGDIYISMDYATATHLCACGCGHKTVTPLAADGWTLRFDGAVTLRPSIGNGQLPCQSHYLVTGNEIEWLPRMGVSATRAAMKVDRRASAQAHAPTADGRWWQRLLAGLGVYGRARSRKRTRSD